MAIGTIITSERIGDTSIGKANEIFEGILENNSYLPDKNGVEYKIHNSKSSSAVTLFTSSPSRPKKINSILRKKYGRLDEEHGIKTIHISLMCNKITMFNNFKFITFLKNDRIHVIAEDLEFYWLFDDLHFRSKTKLEKFNYREAHKLSNTSFLINKEENYEGFKFDNFINLIESGDIFIDIRMGIDRKNKKPHDHGTAFRIFSDKIKHLYNGESVYIPNTLDKFVRY